MKLEIDRTQLWISKTKFIWTVYSKLDKSELYSTYRQKLENFKKHTLKNLLDEL